MPLFREFVQIACVNDARHTVSRYSTHTEVIRFGNFAVKFGRVHVEEALNQQKALELLDPAIIRIPKVYDYFVVKDCAFFVMEFVDGHHPTSAEYAEIVPKVAGCLQYMHTFTRSSPGPSQPGVSRGIIWTDDRELSFTSKSFLASYINSRLLPSSGIVDLTDTQMVLCHLDAAPRNVLLVGSQICLLDWESAGYYPRAFEFCSIRLNCGRNGEDSKYALMLDEALAQVDPLEPHELGQDTLMERVSGNNIKYTFSSKKHTSKHKSRIKIDHAVAEQEQT